MKKISWRFALIFVFVVIASFLLLWLGRNPFLNLVMSDNDVLNHYFNYELATLPIALVTLGLIYLLAHDLKLSLFSLSKVDAPVEPTPLLGIREPGKERWKSVGLSIGLIITLVTAVVMFLGTRGKTFSGQLIPEVLWILLFALMNSFIEEVIFRLSFVSVGENEKLPRWITLLFGALVFGVVHYFGMAPNGILGVFMASFIGFFLTKSILETRGFFWAWLIHFLQDVVIISALVLWV